MTIRQTALRFTLMLGALTCLAPAAAQAQAAPVAVAQPIALDDRLNVSGERFLRETKKVIVPTIVVRYSLRGSLFVANQGRAWQSSTSTARAKGRYVVAGLDKEYLQGLSKQLYDDLVARLRAAGYEVLTFDDIKDIPEVQRMPRFKPDEAWGMPTVNPTGVNIEYAVGFPSDAQAIDPPFQGYGWGFRKVAKDLEATVIVPEYTINAPLLGGSTRDGVNSRSASVAVTPRMSMHAMFMFWNEKMAGGSMMLKAPVGDLGGDVGQIGGVEDDSPAAANAIARGLSVLTGAGDMQTSSTNYGMKVDRAAYTEQFLRAAASFNIAAVGVAQKQRR